MLKQIRILGDHHNNHSVEFYKQELAAFISEDTEAIYLEQTAEDEILRDLVLSIAFLLNPLFVLWVFYKVIQIWVLGSIYLKLGLVSIPRNGDMTPSKIGAEFRAGIELAVERGLDCEKVDMTPSTMVRTQGLRWTLGSWAGFMSYLSVVVALVVYSLIPMFRAVVAGKEGALQGFVIVLFLFLLICWLLGKSLYSLYVNRFSASTNPQRNRYMFSKIQERCEERGFQDVCLIVGENHIPHFKEYLRRLNDVEAIFKDLS